MSIPVQDVQTLLSVYDMPTSVRFYTELLGLEVLSRSPTYEVIDGVEHFHWCMLGQRDVRLMLNTEYDTGERPPQRPVVPEQPFGAWLFFGCPDVDAAYQQLQAAGVAWDPPSLAKYGFRTLSFRYPDGHGITLQWPVQPSVD
jgi:catechol 2,3-dioxygenase-like lactoylglutathione lyase family enzyme